MYRLLISDRSLESSDTGAKGDTMINFDEEIKKFHPSLEIDDTEDAIYNSSVTDMTDIMLELMEEMKEN